ncbi:MAG: Wzz/FepE/Etk N-terminal domain-containing protein [Magnetococcus sp. YQC-9]
MTSPPDLSPSPTGSPLPLRYETDDEIDLFEMILKLWDAKWLIIAVTSLFVAGSVTYAFMATPSFKADILLEPAGDDAKKGGGVLAQFGGLAAMAGINISGGGTSKDTAIAKLKSRIFLEEFIRDENLMPILFEDQWDSSAKTWKEQDPKKQPTLLRGVELFSMNLLKITEDKKSGLVILTIEWKNRELASRWANLLVERINRHLRTLAIEDAKNNIEYLNAEMAKTTFVELKQVIAALTEDQIKKIMLANGRPEFAFRVIDPAVVPERRSWPKRGIIVILGGSSGLLFGISSVFIRNSWRTRKARFTQTPP